MTVFFMNERPLDLNAIRVMGVSVKGKESPIGRFGTGIKYAISVLLRTGHTVELKVGGQIYVFTKRAEIIAGGEFDRCYMNEEALSFTTLLGQDWNVWQAYRELHSNTLDEGGEISTKVRNAETIIMVNGAEFQRCYEERKTIFLSTTPIETVEGIEIHPGRSFYVFYRGVRAMKLNEPTIRTYNILDQIKLTEDRTIESQWEVEYRLSTRLPLTKDKKLASDLTTPVAGKGSWDQNLAFNYCSTPSSVFMEVAGRHKSNANLNNSIRQMVEAAEQAEGVFPEVQPGPSQIATLRATYDLLTWLDCDLDAYEVTLVDTLGPDVMGIYHTNRDQIFLTRAALDQGPNYAAMVLYEEWLHKRHKLKDNTRAMQTFLLGRLVAAATSRMNAALSRDEL